MSDIFISYASEDRVHARRLARALEFRGWSVWWDRTIPAGNTFAGVIEAALARAKCVVVLWSRSSVASRWVRTECEEAAARGILVPAILEQIRIPLAYRRVQAADLTSWSGGGDEGSPEFQGLLADIDLYLNPTDVTRKRRVRQRIALGGTSLGFVPRRVSRTPALPSLCRSKRGRWGTRRSRREYTEAHPTLYGLETVRLAIGRVTVSHDR